MDPSAGVTPPPLDATLARAVCDGSEPGQAGPICDILSKSGLTDCDLIHGLAAVTAGNFATELRDFAAETKLDINFDLIYSPHRVAWARARAMVTIMGRCFEPASSDSTGFVSNTPDPPRLNVLAGSQSGRSEKVGEWLRSNVDAFSISASIARINPGGDSHDSTQIENHTDFEANLAATQLAKPSEPSLNGDFLP